MTTEDDMETFELRLRRQIPFSLPGPWRSVQARGFEDKTLAEVLPDLLGAWLATHCLTYSCLQEMAMDPGMWEAGARWNDGPCVLTLEIRRAGEGGWQSINLHVNYRPEFRYEEIDE